MVGPINPAGIPGIQAEVSKANAKPQSDSTNSAPTSGPTDTVDVPGTGNLGETDVPTDLDAARATAKQVSEQLSGQSYNIANVRTQGLSALFRAA
jgi:hypothetical protein